MNKIREIIEKYATDEDYSKQSLANKTYTPYFIIDESDFDKLEKELEAYITKNYRKIHGSHDVDEFYKDKK